MATEFSCSTCGKSISYAASKCSSCGAPVTQADIQSRRAASEAKARNAVFVVGIPLTLIVVGWLAVTLAGRGTQSIRATGPSEVSMITAAQNAVKSRLRDPSSASFRNETIGRIAGKQVVVCGEVNAKNGFGGMTGFSRYISNGGSETVLETEMEGGDFSPVWNKMGC